MGIILDSSVFIAKERKGQNARQALIELSEQFTGEELAMSIMSVVELAHGIARADTPQRKAKRQEYLTQLTTTLQVQAITIPVALRAGRIDGENAANIRHFRLIPGLRVVSL